MDPAAHRHPRAPHRRSRRRDVRPGARGVAQGDRARRPDARRHRLHRRRHDDARHAVSEHRLRAAGQDRRDARLGLRPGRRLLGLHLRADDRRRRWWRPAPAGTRWSSAPTSCRASSTTPIARPACSSATAPAPCVVEASDDDDIGILDFENYVDGSGGPALCMPAGGSRLPASQETVEQRLHYVKQDGQTVFKFAVRNMEEVCRRILERNGIKPGDIDLFVPHQANSRIIQRGRREARPAATRRSSSTSSGSATPRPATIPLALNDAVESGPPEARRSRAAGVGRRRLHGRRGAAEMGAQGCDQGRRE